MNANWNDICERAAQVGNRYGRSLEKAERFIQKFGERNAIFGIEDLVFHETKDTLQYLNTGDTYTTTVGQENDGALFVTTWGDWWESKEREHEHNANVYHCGYCGSFHPRNNAPDGWDSDGSHCPHNRINQ